MENADEDRIAIHWPEERPPDWPEWETIIRDTTRQWPGPGAVSMERHGDGWRVAAAVVHTDPPQPAKDKQRRHRVTEALRARGKPAGLGA